jgi:hypothetical protein
LAGLPTISALLEQSVVEISCDAQHKTQPLLLPSRRIEPNAMHPTHAESLAEHNATIVALRARTTRTSLSMSPLAVTRYAHVTHCCGPPIAGWVPARRRSPRVRCLASRSRRAKWADRSALARMVLTSVFRNLDYEVQPCRNDHPSCPSHRSWARCVRSRRLLGNCFECIVRE